MTRRRKERINSRWTSLKIQIILLTPTQVLRQPLRRNGDAAVLRVAKIKKLHRPLRRKAHLYLVLGRGSVVVPRKKRRKMMERHLRSGLGDDLPKIRNLPQQKGQAVRQANQARGRDEDDRRRRQPHNFLPSSSISTFFSSSWLVPILTLRRMLCILSPGNL